MPEPITARTSHPAYSSENEDDPLCREPAAVRCACAPQEPELTCQEARTTGEEDPPIDRERARGRAGDRAHEVPDYVTVAAGIGAIVGVGLSLTVDRYGETYLGVASGVGLSAKTSGFGAAAGRLIDTPAAGASPSEVRAFLQGDSVSASVGGGASVSIVSSATGTATELGLGTPQVGAQFQHNWHLWHSPVHW